MTIAVTQSWLGGSVHGHDSKVVNLQGPLSRLSRRHDVVEATISVQHKKGTFSGAGNSGL